MNYTKAIEKLTSKGKFYIDLGLERISQALELMGNPQEDLNCIHVAGTNGKGSTCAIIASILEAAGFKVGLYTSPHIFEYTERIQINGVQISRDCFAQKISKICDLPIHLTEFEILTCCAFEYFKENEVDFVVLETGLGGRLDATNVIKNPICSVITHIDFDHTERLGDTIEKIAFEKAGIIKTSPTIIAQGNLGLSVIQNQCLPTIVSAQHSETLSLKGRHQDENLALALEAVCLAVPNLSYDAIEDGLKNVKHPCRFEYIKEKNLIVDGAHNPNGIQALRDSLDLYFPNMERRFIFGCLKNKKYDEMIEILFKQGDEIFFNHFDYPNSATFEELQKVCQYRAKPFSEFEIEKDKLTIICGSFYMLSTLKNVI